MLMNWYEELASLEYLGLMKGIRVQKTPISKLASGRVLYHPTTVYNYDNIVICRKDNQIDGELLYQVRTQKIPDKPGMYLVTGKIFESIVPVKYEMTEEEIEHYFMVIPKTNGSIMTMRKRIAAQSIKGNQ